MAKIFFYVFNEFDELNFAEKYRVQYGINYEHCVEYPSMENAEWVKGCDTVSMPPCEIGEPLLKKYAELGVKYIACRSIGYDHVDLAAAKRLGLKVSNSSYPPDGVADYAVMLLLMCSRKMGFLLKQTEAQNFSLKDKRGGDLGTSTVGIIGTGKIGCTVMKRLSAFGCKILAYDPFHNLEAEKYGTYVDLDTLYRESDYITLHTNATDENYHLLNGEAFAKMKNGVNIVNTARGQLIDSQALITAIEQRKIGTVALDVFENEDGMIYKDLTGVRFTNHELAILRSFPNVIFTPHMAFYTDGGVDNKMKGVFESVDAFERGIFNSHQVG